MGIPWLKKFWSFCTLGRHGWRKNFPAAEGGRQIFWVVPWEFDPQMIFFACPCMITIKFRFVKDEAHGGTLVVVMCDFYETKSR